MRIAVLVLAACLVPAAAPQSVARGSIPAALQGSWKGTGSQSDHPGDWTIALTLADGAPGGVVGTITYPSLACGGDLILRGTDSGQVELLERITFGECADGGIVTLGGARDGGGLGDGWRHESAPPPPSGMLSRATPPPPR